jgi:hypothetical protein
LQAALHGKSLPLRCYSADPVAHYVWSTGSLALQPVAIHTLALFTTKTVQMEDSKLLIVGERATIASGDEKKKWGQLTKTPMTIQIDVTSADLETVLPLLQDSLFFSTIDAALENLPDDIAAAIPWNNTLKSGQSIVAKNSMLTNITPPKLVEAAHASVSATDPAQQKLADGTVVYLTRVSSTGAVDGLWLARGLGAGMDESAAAAVHKYRFEPAQFDGHPVDALVAVEVAFDARHTP